MLSNQIKKSSIPGFLSESSFNNNFKYINNLHNKNIIPLNILNEKIYPQGCSDLELLFCSTFIYACIASCAAESAGTATYPCVLGCLAAAGRGGCGSCIDRVGGVEMN